MDLQSLWEKRIASFFGQIGKYVAIIASSVFYVLIIGGSLFIYYYFTLLKQLPASFPREAVAALFISFITLRMRIRTFFNKADVVFLLAAESHLSFYIKKTLLYSAVVNSFTLIVSVVIVIPLVNTFQLATWVVISIAALFLTIWFVWVKQWLASRLSHFIHGCIHFVSIWAMFFFLFQERWLIAFLLFIVNVAFLFVLFGQRKRGFNWLYLINQEEKNNERLYRFIHLFVDVPHLKNTFHKRSLFINLIEKVVSFKQSSTYTFLFLRLAIRYDQYFGMHVRLTLIGFLVLYMIPANPWLVAICILYMTGYQLLPLHRARNELVRLYPLHDSLLKESFLTVILSLLLVQAGAFTFVSLFTHSLLDTSLTVFAQGLFIAWFVYWFAKKRIKINT
ncbi:ABC transporter permease [Bacillus sp. CGMCC 1.16541]|uniref:ABC transporter permease n=1 Tax=Bacillus sp. CGMCC 1.16541 TaxID=2185143 RepID=UPI000D725D85|nr:ABC transporter permease [Bacillus sp. CGMCC 1.16541]